MASPVSKATHLKFKRIVWVGAISAITVVGAGYGATLRSQGQMNKRLRKEREATVADRIRLLEEQKAGLVIKKKALERKLEQVVSRRDGQATAGRG